MHDHTTCTYVHTVCTCTTCIQVGSDNIQCTYIHSCIVTQSSRILKKWVGQVSYREWTIRELDYQREQTVLQQSVLWSLIKQGRKYNIQRSGHWSISGQIALHAWPSTFCSIKITCACAGVNFTSRVHNIMLVASYPGSILSPWNSWAIGAGPSD